MFVVKPSVDLHGDKNYHKKKKYLKKYDKYAAQNYGQNYDLRLILVRHAERIDIVLGENWYQQIFGAPTPAPISPQLYRNPLLPRRLPYRLNTLLYEFDPPITRTGEQKSIIQGQNLARMGTTVDYCYSSPACRSVLTANGLLEGLGRRSVPIRIEPTLFEPLSWNTPLQDLEDIPPFMSTAEWIQSGYNIDGRYRRLYDYLSIYETENDFYKRSRLFFQSIEHGYNRGRPTNILVVGHAATPLIYSIIAQRQPFNAELFGQQCGAIPFLQTVVLERNATNRIWNVRPIMSFV